MAAAREQIAHHHLQGFTPRLQQFFIKTDNFRHSANPNTPVETGDGDFVQVVRALQNKGCRVEVLAFDNVSEELRREAGALKEVVADLVLENRLLKKSMTGAGGDEA